MPTTFATRLDLPEAFWADDSLQRVLAFVRRFGKDHRILAMHAALPLGLTADLVHLIRLNFVRHAPWIAEADLLLSPLCREVGGDMYEMRPGVRELLLSEFKRDPLTGVPTLRRLAEFLSLYSTQALKTAVSAELRDYLESQQWAAQAQLAPAAAAESLASAMGKALTTTDLPQTARIVQLTRSLSTSLLTQPEFLIYAAAVERLASSDPEDPRPLIGALGARDAPVQIGGITLPSPNALMLTLGAGFSTETEEDVSSAAEPGAEGDEVPEQSYQEERSGVNLRHTLAGHERDICSLAFDPTGSRLASGGLDGSLRLWDVETGNLVQTLEGHANAVQSLSFDREGRVLASGGHEPTVKLWEVETGRLLTSLEADEYYVFSVAFEPSGRTLATGGNDMTVKVWDWESGRLLRTLTGHTSIIYGLAADPTGRTLVSASRDTTLRLWDPHNGSWLRTFSGHEDFAISVAFDPKGQLIASGSSDKTVRVWDVNTGRLLQTFEGHTGSVDAVAFSPNGLLLASKSADGVRLWNCETWASVAVIPGTPTFPNSPNIAFHQTLPLLATVSSTTEAADEQPSRLISVWELDYEFLLSESIPAKAPDIRHATAKIVLLGDSGAGKTGLGWRLAHGEFKEHSSTHGQQFWVLDQLSTTLKDGTECEAVLWDLAGQPDYRLTHSLFLDDADLALIVFHPTRDSDPLQGVNFWLSQLKSSFGNRETRCPIILVAAQIDTGEPRLTEEEMRQFCQRHNIDDYVATSAVQNLGMDRLIESMRKLIRWDEKPVTVTTVTLQRIKDFVLRLKEEEQRGVLFAPEALAMQFRRADSTLEFTYAEMMTALGQLENYGFVRLLRTSLGDNLVLLEPALVNNLAASFVLEARRDPKSLGSLDEKRLLEGGYSFPELQGLTEKESAVLLESVTLLFLQHNQCFREMVQPNQSLLVFPELINVRKPQFDLEKSDDGAEYLVTGATDNLFASLTILLGYTPAFTRTNQWRNQARYELPDGSICGFRMDKNSEAELTFVLYFSPKTLPPSRALFQGLFESFLARRNLTVRRSEPLFCPNAHRLSAEIVRKLSTEGKSFAFCLDCGEKIELPKLDEPIQLTSLEQSQVEEQEQYASRRSLFEQALFQVTAYTQGKTRPSCFVSYAKGDKDQELWVSQRLMGDLRKAGIIVSLSSGLEPGSTPPLVEQIARNDFVIVVGSLLYRSQYEEQVRAGIKAEVTTIVGSGKGTGRILPLVFDGDVRSSLPSMLQGLVHSDFRRAESYFPVLFDLVLAIYQIPLQNGPMSHLRTSLRSGSPQ